MSQAAPESGNEARGGVRRLRDVPRPLSHPDLLLITGFGSGLAPRAPGTAGSAVAVLLWWWLLADLAWPLQLAVVLVTFVAGIAVSARAMRRHGLGDDPSIVIDEFAGQWLTLVAAPAHPLAALVGFLLFRIFDILKPWPVSVADRKVHGGLGVMLDDLLAGALAWMTFAVLLQWVGRG
jgi:phosphatidylglycerophosphatase A